MITRTLLHAIRNQLPMAATFERLGNQAPYSKHTDGRFRFICPQCSELQATLNPRSNLAHCFNCRRNTNNIDLMLHLGYGFKEAVERLEKWLYEFRENAWKKKKPPDPPNSPVQPAARSTGAQRIAQILRQEFDRQE